MNKKITVRRSDGALMYCVISPEREECAQLNEVMGFSGGSFFASSYEKEIRIVSRVDFQEWGSLPVISREDTGLPVSLRWENVPLSV